MTTFAPSPSDRPAMLHWLRLMRIPNVFTAVADTAAACLIADGNWARRGLIGTLLVATCCFYLAGMVLNDVFDVAVDRKERPERPLPSGKIALTQARCVGFGLWICGLVFAWIAQSEARGAAAWGPGVWGSILAVCILLYNAKLKSTLLGPAVMGACRGTNIAMAISIANNPVLIQSPSPWLVAVAIGIYVVGITWFARHEADSSPRVTLVAGLLLMLVGVATLVIVIQRAWPTSLAVTFNEPWVWPLLMCLLTFPVWRRAIKAVYTLRGSDVQLTVKQAILSLIAIDAGVALVTAGQWHGLGIFLLSLPTIYLARFVAMT